MSGTIRSMLTSVMKTLASHMDSANTILSQEPAVAQLRRALPLFEQLRCSLQGIQDQLVFWSDLMSKMADDKVGAEETKMEAFKVQGKTPSDLYVEGKEVLIKLSLHIDTIRAAAGQQPGGNGTGGNGTGGNGNGHGFGGIQLPRLNLPEFSGDPVEWSSFWEAFVAAVDSHTALSPAQKMTYLCGQLKGSAKSVVVGLSMTADDYKIATDLLVERYGDITKRVQELQQELWNLPIATHHPSSLRSLSNSVERICRQLKMMNMDLDGNGFLITAIMGKLPSDVRLQLTEKEMDSGHKWTPVEWREGLLRAVKIREAAHVDGPRQPQQYQNKVQNYQKVPQNPGQAPNYGQNNTGQVRRAFPMVAGNQVPNAPTKIGKNGCSLCLQNGHRPGMCTTYSTPDARKQRLLQQSRCVICARQHSSNACPRAAGHGCMKCGSADHCSLICCSRKVVQTGGNSQTVGSYRGNKGNAQQHFQQHQSFAVPPQQNQVTIPQQPKPKPLYKHPNQPAQQHAAIVSVSHSLESAQWESQIKSNAYLMMLEVPVLSRGPEPIKVPVFLDPGAQMNFITNELVKFISPRKVANGEMSISGFGGSETAKFDSPKFAIFLQKTDGSYEQIIANKTPKITSSFEFLSNSTPQFYGENGQLVAKVAEPAILLGVGSFWRCFLSIEPIKSGLFRVETIFGSAYCGEVFANRIQPSVAHCCPMIQSVESGPSLDTAVKQMWQLDTIGITDSPVDNDNEKAMQLFQNSIKKDSEGRYVVGWPRRDPNLFPPDNFGVAFSRLAMLSPRLRSSPALLEGYEKIIKEQLEKEIIEPAEKTGKVGEHFLPHHPVLGSKLRVVFDASSHVRNKPSLNDCLLPGPNLLQDLAGILLRFRTSPFPVLSDIEKAFLNVGLAEEDRECAKFLFYKDPSKPLSPSNLVIYRFRRIAFGVVSSPFILAATIRHHLADEGGNFGQEMVRNLYVDNLLLRCNSVEEAQAKAKEAQRIFAGAKMRLREFVSCSPAALEALPAEDRLEGNDQKALGLNWKTDKDLLIFHFPGSSPEGPHTRRTVLSKAASFFDPLGLCSPCIILAKLFFQTLWETKKHWDEPLDEKDAKKWVEIMTDWDFSLPITRYTPAEGESVQLHIFADAGPLVYATVAYLRVVTPAGVRISVVFAKCRLRPMKLATESPVTIPRMELLALLLAVRVKKFVAENCDLAIDGIFIWGDSQIVLNWLRSTEPQPIFIANRISEIRRHRDAKFGYVRSKENPADIGTRGANTRDLPHSSWFVGPDWLKQEPAAWPNEFAVELPPEEGPEPLIVAVAAAVPRPVGNLLIPANYSCFSRLVAHGAVLLHFLKWKMEKSKKFCEKFPQIMALSPEGPRDVGSRQLAKKLIIRIEQNGEITHGTAIDSEGLIRLKTRLANADLPEDVKYPLVLPNGRLVRLIILNSHDKLAHSGVDATLADFLRLYWVPKARKLVRSVVRECHVCQRDRAVPFALPPMPDWPKSRVCPSTPFESIGLDYLGHTHFKSAEGPKKAWVIIFTCLSTRAVHLEPTQGLSTEEFLLSFRRFVARRGLPKEVLSDHGTQLVLARETLKHCPDLALNWRLIPELSPWSGGIYERLVGLVKGAFRRSLGKKVLTWPQFETFTAEVEAILNSRPITFVSQEKDGPLALRPIDFLQPKAQLTFLEPNEDLGDTFRPTPAEKMASMWWATTRALSNFWEIWLQDYLLLLRSQTQTKHVGPRCQITDPIQVGHIVLVEQEGMAKNLWPMGRVVALNGQPGRVRSAKIQMPNGNVLGRPINLLVPLEVAPDGAEPELGDNDLEKAMENPPPVERRTRRGRKPEVVEQTEQQPRPATRRIRWSSRQPRPADVLAVLFAICCFFSISQASDVFRCHLKGILIKAPPESYSIDVCCDGSCATRADPKGAFFLPIPTESLVTGFSCFGSVWHQQNSSKEYSLECPATDSCSLLDCTFCWETVFNPQCSPWLSAALLGGLGIILMTICCCLCMCLSLSRKMTRNVFWLCRLAAKCIKQKRRPNRPQTIFSSEDDEEDIPLPPPRNRRRKKQQFLTSVGHLLAGMALLGVAVLPLAKAGIDVVSMTAETEDCYVNVNGTECSFNKITFMTLLPGGQPTTLILKESKGVPVGTFSFILQGLHLECVPETKAWLRSYRVDTYASKRCPGAGSCEGKICSALRPNETVDELRDVQRFPGNNYCVDSSSFIFQGCASPKDACLFYRTYIFPLSNTAYEVVECPTWEFKMNILLRLEIPEMEAIEEEVVLLPGRTFRWGKAGVSLTPSPMGQPPIPLLNGWFLTNWHSAALVDQFTLDLHCADEFAAKQMECSLATEACSHCRPDHSAGSVRCSCRELDLETMIKDEFRKLPMTVGQIQLNYHNDRFWAETAYTPIHMAAKMEGLTLVARHELSLCHLTPHNLTGCYKCRTGARFSFHCQSTLGEHLADVQCTDGTSFVAKCPPEGREIQSTLSWQTAEVETACSVECPAGKTHFNLEGVLAYVPPRRPRWTREGRASSKEASSSFQFPSVDFGHILRSLMGPQIIILVVVLIGGIILLLLIIRLNPIFMAYRLVSRRVVVLVCILSLASGSSAQAIPFEPERELQWLPIILIFASLSLLAMACLIGYNPSWDRVFVANFTTWRNQHTVHPNNVNTVIEIPLDGDEEDEERQSDEDPRL